MKKIIYLDNNATTILSKEALKAIEKELKGNPANPSSAHFLGQQAKAKLLDAKESIANFLGVKSQNLIFTSGGTESANSIIRGLVSPYEGCHIISSDIEHACVFNTLEDMKEKYAVSLLKTGNKGFLNPEEIEKELRPDTKLIITSAVNSETGVKSNIEQLSAMALRHGLLLAIDGVALLGKESFSIPKGVASIFFSSHKLHGPKGCGLIYLQSGIKFHPLILGGPQENNKRAGTENLAAILGFKEAIMSLKRVLPKANSQMTFLRDLFEKKITEKLKYVKINGMTNRICNTSNLAFEDIDGETLLILLSQNGIAASMGSACSSGSLKPSRILLNMGYEEKRVRSSLRFSLSRYTTLREIETAVSKIVKVAKSL